MSQNTTDRQLVTLVLVVLGALVVLPALIMGFGMMGFGSMMGGMWGSGMLGAGQAPAWMVLMSAIMQLVFLVVIVGAGYLVYRAVTDSTSGSDPAMEELRAAYARGDLTDEEYEKRREALQ